MPFSLLSVSVWMDGWKWFALSVDIISSVREMPLHKRGGAKVSSRTRKEERGKEEAEIRVLEQRIKAETPASGVRHCPFALHRSLSAAGLSAGR
jgi:hypothetical protein